LGGKENPLHQRIPKNCFPKKIELKQMIHLWTTNQPPYYSLTAPRLPPLHVPASHDLPSPSSSFFFTTKQIGNSMFRSSKLQMYNGRPDPPVARSGRIGPARYGPLRATGHTGRTTYGLEPRLRPMARSTGHFIGPRITRAAFDRATGQSAQYQNESQIHLTRLI
jgi:hypothetical protein